MYLLAVHHPVLLNVIAIPILFFFLIKQTCPILKWIWETTYVYLFFEKKTKKKKIEIKSAGP